MAVDREDSLTPFTINRNMDVNISANTLFHFTSDRQSLLSILENGLYVRYSLENYENIISEKSEIAFPMTSFCDIPLSQVKRHSSKYGQYAIGLTKNWGMKNKINPVIYTYPTSTTSDLLRDVVEELQNFFDIAEEERPKLKKRSTRFRTKEEFDLQALLNDPTFKYKEAVGNKIERLQFKIAHFIKYIKPCEGKFFRNGQYLEKPVKFYEEREWRFAPSKEFFLTIDLKDSYEAEYYKNPVKRRAINIRLAKHLKLNFRASDIRFIIVERDKEIPKLLEDIERIFGNSTPYKDLKLLGTRLISLEQILEDL
jgi:hypothetical protein